MIMFQWNIIVIEVLKRCFNFVGMVIERKHDSKTFALKFLTKQLLLVRKTKSMLFSFPGSDDIDEVEVKLKCCGKTKICYMYGQHQSYW